MDRFLSLAEIYRLEAVLATSSENRWGLIIIRLLLLMGCRRNEIAALRWSQVHFDQRMLRIGLSKGFERHVFLSDEALDAPAFTPRDARDGTDTLGILRGSRGSPQPCVAIGVRPLWYAALGRTASGRGDSSSRGSCAGPPC
ncbi:MAG: tyrosine-type recombinase/integrase [Brevundimonas sp.]|uniref:tyrosine-type recombinase/integrase n=1 Tax=Brevundimonas sp. TaxID=1871086 RepID=UPI00391BCACF